MKKRISILSLALAGLFIMGGLVFSCSKSNEVDLKQKYGITSGSCDTVGMTYQADILPIIKANCYGCHSADTYQSSGSQLNYEDFDILKAEIQNGDLLNAIQHKGSVTPMPLNLPALSDCDINKIKDWINNGIQNN